MSIILRSSSASASLWPPPSVPRSLALLLPYGTGHLLPIMPSLWLPGHLLQPTDSVSPTTDPAVVLLTFVLQCLTESLGWALPTGAWTVVEGREEGSQELGQVGLAPASRSHRPDAGQSCLAVSA